MMDRVRRPVSSGTGRRVVNHRVRSRRKDGGLGTRLIAAHTARINSQCHHVNPSTISPLTARVPDRSYCGQWVLGLLNCEPTAAP